MCIGVRLLFFETLSDSSNAAKITLLVAIKILIAHEFVINVYMGQRVTDHPCCLCTRPSYRSTL